MKTIILIIFAATICLSFDYSKKINKSGSTKRAGCIAPSSSLEMNYNDVSARLETNGVLFLDKKNSVVGSYIVPKKSGVSAIYASSLWIGGVDVNGQLKLAAQKFGSTGNDFWTGPLSSLSNTGNYNPTKPVGDNNIRSYGEGNISSDDCIAFDKFFTIRKAEVIQFIYWWECKNNFRVEGCKSIIEPTNDVLNRINNWPAHGDVSKGQDKYLAPFYDRDNDGEYSPSKGDYPWYDDILGKDDIKCGSDRRISLFGDETNWWVFNDLGNSHTESGGAPIGIEVRAQAYSFSNSNELNQMTFYNYEMINRSTQTLYKSYFSQYVDADLGNPADDYVGCDVTRGLGYCYNGDNFDEDNAGIKGYGLSPPAIGIDFFEGPYQDADGKDNIGPRYINNKLSLPSVVQAIEDQGIVYSGLGIGYGDGIVDNERFGMKRFNYYTANATQTQSDPTTAANFYNYMNGKWRFGDRTVFGGTGFPGSVGATSEFADYMFPGDSDTLNWGTSGINPGVKNWSELTNKNTAGDRRFVQSAGPFTLRPGSVNNITVGIVYARSSEGDLLASVRSLKRADTKAQALFDNCFKTMEAPNAPKLSSIQLDNQIILTLENPIISNNYLESYNIEDPYILDNEDGTENFKFFRFEGYQIYQLKDEFVSVTDLDNSDKARVIAQCDIKNGIKDLVNYEYNSEIGFSIPVRKVTATDNGIKHSFIVDKDLFSIGNNLEMNKKYYFIAVAYAHNNYKTYVPDNPNNLDGQKTPYLRSNKTFDGKTITPFEVKLENSSDKNLLPKSTYGYSPEITRIDGKGNGKNFLVLSQDSKDSIVKSGFFHKLTYENGKGPLNIKVVDPLSLAKGYFECKFRGYKSETLNQAKNNKGIDTAEWIIYRYDKKGGVILDSVSSDLTIQSDNEQIIPHWGISIQINQNEYYFTDVNKKTYSISDEYKRFTDPINAIMTFQDSSKKWLTGISDREEYTPYNWIRSGTNEYKPNPNDDLLGIFNPKFYPDQKNTYGDAFMDPEKKYSKLLNGIIAPHCLVGYQGEFMPLAYPDKILSPNDVRDITSISRLNNIDIVITKDTSLWTRCAVIELGRKIIGNEGGAKSGTLRKGKSVDKLGRPTGSSNGMGWFPGYAIDVESGMRLHMAFGENSFLTGDNGRDMIWNPSNVSHDSNGDFHFGGQHAIYVFGVNVHGYTDNSKNCPYYDGKNNWVYDKLTSDNVSDYLSVFQNLLWIANPLAIKNNFSIETDCKISVRVNKEYNDFTATGLNKGKPMYAWEIKGTELPVYKIKNQQKICNGEAYQINGKKYTKTGIYEDVFKSKNGLDSIIVTELTVKDKITFEEVKQICQGETYNGYSKAGVYSKKLTSSSGCDSIYLLKLSVNPLPKVTLTFKESLCNNSGIYYLDSLNAGLPKGGVFTGDLVQKNNLLDPKGLSGTIILTYTYTDELGCSSSVSNGLKIIDRYGTSNCKVGSIDEKVNTMLTIYPNPTNDIFSIITLSKIPLINFTVTITDLVGKQLQKVKLQQIQTDISLRNLGPEGVYMVNLYDKDGHFIRCHRVVLSN